MATIQDEALAAGREAFPALTWKTNEGGADSDSQVNVFKFELETRWNACAGAIGCYGATAIEAAKELRAAMVRERDWLNAALSVPGPVKPPEKLTSGWWACDNCGRAVERMQGGAIGGKLWVDKGGSTVCGIGDLPHEVNR